MSADEEQIVTVEVDVEAKDEIPNGGSVEPVVDGETAAGAEETTANGGTAAAAASEEQPPAVADAGGEDSGTEDVVEANGNVIFHTQPLSQQLEH